MSALLRVNALFNDSIDDSVWQDICSSRINNLPSCFDCYRNYYRCVIRGQAMSSADVFMIPLHALITSNGSTAQAKLISPSNPPAVQLLRRHAVDLILLERPEHCLVGFTDDTRIRSTPACWSRSHRVFPLAFTIPGTVVRLSLVDEDVNDGSGAKQVVFTVENLLHECAAAVMERHVVSLAQPRSAKDLTFLIALAANGAKVSVL